MNLLAVGYRISDGQTFFKMAEGKKSFIAYSDWKDVFDALPNEDAGLLIKHIFSYVNDENPKTDSILINAVFANIKTTLKRDLVKYNLFVLKQKENGAKGGRPKKGEETQNNPTLILDNPTEPKKADSVSDSVNVNDSVSVILEKETKFDFKNKLIVYGFKENLVSDWLKVRKTKKATNTETAFNSFILEIERKPCNINEMLLECVKNSWSGFKHEWIDNLNKKNNGTGKQSTFEAAIGAVERAKKREAGIN